jgi:uncharacterized DUF497 family protein
MKLHIAGIEWDDGNQQKCQKHGLTIAEIEAFLLGDDHRIQADFKHSGDAEQRFIAFGKVDGRWVYIAFTLRAKQTGIMIRPISARYMREKEAEYYGKNPPPH